MEQMERRRKLQLLINLLQLPEWNLVESEILRIIKGKRMELNSCQRRGEVYNSQFLGGVIEGLETALMLPNKLRKENQSFIDRIMELTNHE